MKIGRIVTKTMLRNSKYGISHTGMFSVPDETRICGVCGKKFKPETRHQKYCCYKCRIESQRGLYKQVYLKRGHIKTGHRTSTGIANNRKEL